MTETEDEYPYEDWTKAELVAEIRSRNDQGEAWDVKGTKAELIRRLEASDEAAARAAEKLELPDPEDDASDPTTTSQPRDGAVIAEDDTADDDEPDPDDEDDEPTSPLPVAPPPPVMATDPDPTPDPADTHPAAEWREYEFDLRPGDPRHPSEEGFSFAAYINAARAAWRAAGFYSEGLQYVSTEGNRIKFRAFLIPRR
jgi:hypothetical protein